MKVKLYPYDGPLEELSRTDCDKCGERLVILSSGPTSATVRCGCGEYDVDFGDGQDEAAVYY